MERHGPEQERLEREAKARTGWPCSIPLEEIHLRARVFVLALAAAGWSNESAIHQAMIDKYFGGRESGETRKLSFLPKAKRLRAFNAAADERFNAYTPDQRAQLIGNTAQQSRTE